MDFIWIVFFYIIDVNINLDLFDKNLNASFKIHLKNNSVKIGSVTTIIITSLTINIADYFVRVIGNNFTQTLISYKTFFKSTDIVWIKIYTINSKPK